MNRIFRICLFFSAAVVALAGAAQSGPVVSLVDESLNYDVYYKWGLINKKAGHATMSLVNDGDLYKASVVAANAPWANKIFFLRDTLYSTMTKRNLYPVDYVYIAHENGRYKRDVVRFTHEGDMFYGQCSRTRRKKKGDPLSTVTTSLEAKGMTVDMLSTFFYLRTLDYAAMTPGNPVVLNIFSATKKERLTITYKGRENIKVGKNRYDTFVLAFTFTRKGVESSAPIIGWISADDRRIPLKVEGELPVGKVRAFFTGETPVN